MKCRKDNTDLVPEMHQGIELDRCAQCNGLWLDYPELDQLEDHVLDVDELKGTMVYSPRPTEDKCPHCGEDMTAFHYRANNLELDMCKHGHGFWLDHGEDKLVQGFMNQRIKDLQRSSTAEAQWTKFLNTKPNKGFVDKIKGFFTGR